VRACVCMRVTRACDVCVCAKILRVLETHEVSATTYKQI